MTAVDPAGTDATAVPSAKKAGTFWHPAPGAYYAATPPAAAPAGTGTTPAPSAAVTPTADRPSQNIALAILWWLGALLFVGGFITMIVGSNRQEPYRSMFDSAAETIVNSMTFAATTTLTELIGGGIVLLGGMALVGALVTTAVKAALGAPAGSPAPQK